MSEPNSSRGDAEPVSEPVPEPVPERPASNRPLLYGCLSVLLAVPFGILYILLTAGLGIVAGPISAAAIVVGMFLLRRENKRPIVGALAVAAAIAFVRAGHVSHHHCEIDVIT